MTVCGLPSHLFYSCPESISANDVEKDEFFYTNLILLEKRLYWQIKAK